MRKLRVLTVLHELSLTGAPKIALDACDALREEVEPFFLALDGGPLEEYCSSMGPLRVLLPKRQAALRAGFAGLGVSFGRAFQIAAYLRAKMQAAKFQKQISKWKPDVIYVNSIASLSLLELLDFPAVPVLLHVHELDSMMQLYVGENDHLLKTRPSRYIAVAGPVRDLLTNTYGIEPQRISLIHELVPDAYTQAVTSSVDRPKDANFVVGGAGYPTWRKGTTLWLQMAAELKRIMGNQVRLIWVGTRDDLAGIYFKEEARKLDVYKQIEFVPVTKTPLEHYAKFDVFAMTSYEDPCPIVVLENMLLEKPVLCFAGSGGAPEEVGETGIVIENFSPVAMAASIAELAADPERRKALGEQARERVRKHFVASQQAPKILHEMQALTSAKTGKD